MAGGVKRGATIRAVAWALACVVGVGLFAAVVVAGGHEPVGWRDGLLGAAEVLVVAVVARWVARRTAVRRRRRGLSATAAFDRAVDWVAARPTWLFVAVVIVLAGLVYAECGSVALAMGDDFDDGVPAAIFVAIVVGTGLRGRDERSRAG